MTPDAWTAFIATLRRELPAEMVWVFDREAARAYSARDWSRMRAMQEYRFRWCSVVRERERAEQSVRES